VELIWALDLDKAPRSDGFTLNFWPLIEKDLLRMLNNSRVKKKLGGGINSSFLALIPKE